MKFSKIFLLLMVVWVHASASTFVGNGGNAGDIELRVSKLTLERSLSQISGYTEIGPELCRCDGEYAAFPACKSLESLSEEQVLFCGRFITERAKQLSDFLNTGITIQWTEETLFVQENKKRLPVDALTDFATKTILINKEKFLNLGSHARNFLLAHELFHLTEAEGKPVIDEQMVGPFRDSTGGRSLLNAASSALVIFSISQNIARQYDKDLSRSRRDKRHWFTVDYAGFKAREDLGTLYVPSDYAGIKVGLQYLPNEAFGFGVHYGMFEAQQNFLGTIEAKDAVKTFGLGAIYRLFPFSDVYSFAGQSFASVGLKYELLLSQFELKESQLVVSDKAQTSYFVAEVNYFVPLKHGFWIQLGASYNNARYGYAEHVDAQFSTGRLGTNLGVSYAF